MVAPVTTKNSFRVLEDECDSEEGLQRVVNEFYSVWKRRKLKVNAGKSKVIVFERREEELEK